VIRAGKEELSLEYEGMIFTPQDMIGTSATPVKLLPALYRAWGMGISENVSFEKTEEGRLIVLDIFSKVDGDEFLLRTWFDERTLFPTKAECFFDGRRVLTCEYSQVTME
jgi:outer membrane lipoprotein-sorting protein